MALGDTLEKTLAIDMSIQSSFYQSVAHLRIEIDISEGLQLSIEISASRISCSQTLDYMNVPFRCVQCHAHGHVVVYYPLPFKQKTWISKAPASERGKEVVNLWNTEMVMEECIKPLVKESPRKETITHEKVTSPYSASKREDTGPSSESNKHNQS